MAIAVMQETALNLCWVSTLIENNGSLQDFLTCAVGFFALEERYVYNSTCLRLIVRSGGATFCDRCSVLFFAAVVM